MATIRKFIGSMAIGWVRKEWCGVWMLSLRAQSAEGNDLGSSRRTSYACAAVGVKN